jgi:hypothetical protein
MGRTARDGVSAAYLPGSLTEDPAASRAHRDTPPAQSAVQAARFGSMEKYCARHAAVQACRFASQLASAVQPGQSRADCAIAGATAAKPRIASANAVRRMF